MRWGHHVVFPAVLGLALLASAPSVSAEQYRLLVASVHEQGVHAYLLARGLREGGARPGRARAASLDGAALGGPAGRAQRVRDRPDDRQAPGAGARGAPGHGPDPPVPGLRAPRPPSEAGRAP